MGKSKKKRRRSVSESSNDDSDDSIEKERRRDLKERDEFSNRLRNKDKERTRNIVRPSGSSGKQSISKLLLSFIPFNIFLTFQTYFHKMFKSAIMFFFPG